MAVRLPVASARRALARRGQLARATAAHLLAEPYHPTLATAPPIVAPAVALRGHSSVFAASGGGAKAGARPCSSMAMGRSQDRSVAGGAGVEAALAAGAGRSAHSGHSLPGGSTLHGPRVKAAEVSKDLGGCLKVTFDAGEAGASGQATCLFPLAYIRDSCRCAECFHPTARGRRVAPPQIAASLSGPTSATVGSEGGKDVIVTWADGHETRLSSTFLWHRRLTPDGVRHRTSMRSEALARPVSWGAEYEIPRFDVSEVLGNWDTRLAFLESVCTRGLSLLTGMADSLSTGRSEVEEFVRQVAEYPRPTYYGSSFEVRAELKANTLAYTTDGLPLHTDLPMYREPPGVQLLHCLRQAGKGGDSLFVDGIRVAEILRNEFPADFRALCTLPVTYSNDKPGITHLRASRPIIRANDAGDILEINYSNHWRSTVLDMNASEAAALYAAMMRWDEVANASTQRVFHRLAPGEVAVLANRRVLHGRTAFEADESATGTRHLQGTYMELDEVEGKLRSALRRIHGADKEHLLEIDLLDIDAPLDST